MSSIDNEILMDFQEESKNLLLEMIQILDICEADEKQVQRLEDYGQTVDRIMGGAKNLALLEPNSEHVIHKIGDYAAICKSVGYKASQINGNAQFFVICVSLLQDATETLEEMVNSLIDNSGIKIKDLLSQTFIDRLRWVSSEFGSDFRASVDVAKGAKKPARMNQNDIDELLKKLGIGADD